jgi:hypothetical protein
MNDVSEVFSDEAELYNRKVSECKKRLKELGFVRIGSGMGRIVWAKEGTDYVLKLPIDYPARHQNSDERENYENQTENRDRLAACRTLSMNGIDVLMMERVIPFSEPDKETGFESMVPAWAENIDCRQVGKSVVDGRICAFDYAGELSGDVFGEKSKIDEMKHDEIVEQAL